MVPECKARVTPNKQLGAKLEGVEALKALDDYVEKLFRIKIKISFIGTVNGVFAFWIFSRWVFGRALCFFGVCCVFYPSRGFAFFNVVKFAAMLLLFVPAKLNLRIPSRVFPQKVGQIEKLCVLCVLWKLFDENLKLSWVP